MQNQVAIIGSGFIGRHIADKLKELDKVPVCIDSRSCDLSTPASAEFLCDLLEDVPCWVVTAAVTRRKSTGEKAFWDNVCIARNIDIALRRLPKAPKVIYLSTTDVYGHVNETISEDQVLSPQTPYALSKLYSEYLMHQWSLDTKGALTIFRLPGIYGPGDGDSSLFGRLAHSAMNKGELSLTHQGQVSRDYVHVEDLANLLAKAIEGKQEGVFNAVTGDSVALSSVAEELELCFPPLEIHYDETTEETNNSLAFDSSHLEEEFGKGVLNTWSKHSSEYLKEFLQTQCRY